MFFGLISTVPVYAALCVYSWFYALLRRRQAELIMQAKAEYLANGEYYNTPPRPNLGGFFMDFCRDKTSRSELMIFDLKVTNFDKA